MAILRNPQQFASRLFAVANQLKYDAVAILVEEAENTSFKLAEASPVDTSKLLSNFRIGEREFDFVMRRAFVTGIRGSTRDLSRTALGLHNKRVGERILATSVGKDFVTVAIENKVSYFGDVEERTPFARRITRDALRNVERRIDNLRIREPINA